MAAKNRKNRGKIDLLEIPESERVNLIEKLKSILRQNATETKLWNALLQCESLTINGQVVFSGEEALNGLIMQKANL
jgi:hypothetical protein